MTTFSTASSRPSSGDVPAPARRPAVPVALCRVFLAMLRKEARELAILMVLIAVGYGAALTLELWQITHRSALGNFDEGGAINSAFMQDGVFIAPLAGLLVGFIQFFVESRPDRFGVLVHRPVSRSMIFGCKSLAGIWLYFLAMLIPLLVALFWASNPRHIPLPFSWWMAQAPLADVLSGIPYYFAGILVARRTDAHWFGSRLLPILAPFIASLMNFLAENIGTSLLGIAVATLVTAVAAHSYFTAAGQYQQVRGHARAAMGFILLTSILITGFLGFALLETLLGIHVSYSGAYKRAMILQDGTPVISDIIDDGSHVLLKDLSGNPLDSFSIKNGRVAGKDSFREMPFYSGYFPENRRPNLIHESSSYFNGTSVRFDNAAWYRAKTRLGGDYLVGFNRMNYGLVGAIGAHGFEPGVAVPATRFGTRVFTCCNFQTETYYNYGSDAYEVPLQGLLLPAENTVYESLLVAGDTIYRALDSGKLEVFYTVPNHQPIVDLYSGSTNGLNAPDKPFRRSYAVVVTNDAVTILSNKADVLVHFEMPGLSRYHVATGQIAEKAGTAGDRLVMKFDDMGDTNFDAELRPTKVAYFKADGSLDHQLELPRFILFIPARFDAIQAYIAVPLAPPLGTACTVISAARTDRHFSDDAAYGRQAMLSSGGVGVLAAGVVWFFGRRKRMGTAAVWTWTLLTLLAGPAGLLLLVCLRGLPRTVKCGHCDKQRRIDEAVCRHCGTAAEVPARNGTEIFV